MSVTEFVHSFWPHLLGIAACLAGSAFFSSAETALTSLSEARVHQIMDRRGHRARHLDLWLRKPSDVITALLIGNNAVNILASALATRVADGVFHDRGLGLAVGAMTLLLLVFGEITPKTYAKHNTERAALAGIGIVRSCYFLFFPAVVALTGLSRLIVHLSGGNTRSSEGPVTEKDIEFLIDLGQREGVIEKHEEQMLHSVLELSDTVTREVMVPRTNMTSVPLDVDRDRLLKVIVEAGYSRVPVYDGSVDNIVGLIHAKDLLRFAGPDACNQPFRIQDILRPVYYVPESMRISDLLKEFQRRKTHLAVVVDEYGGTAGIVAMEDIIEEIVGEIHDEYDVEEKQLRRLPDGRFLADARISIHDLGEQLGVEFPEVEGFETLGGFVTALRGRLPVAGDRQDWKEFQFIVREADEKRVLKVEILPGGAAAAQSGAPLAQVPADNASPGKKTGGGGRAGPSPLAGAPGRGAAAGETRPGSAEGQD